MVKRRAHRSDREPRLCAEATIVLVASILGEFDRT